MMARRLLIGSVLVGVVVGCEAPAPKPAADSTTVAAPDPDSLARALATQAAELRDTAEATLATLLDNPATATWDSVVVVQPPRQDGRLPAMAVCGRIGGRPGVKGTRTPVRFIYLTKFTVFVEEAKNRGQFADVWNKNCAVPPGEVVAGGEDGGRRTEG